MIIQVATTPRETSVTVDTETRLCLDAAHTAYDRQDWRLLRGLSMRLTNLYMLAGDYPEAARWLQRASDAASKSA